MLLNFPPEIIDLILDEVTEPADLKRLCEVSKHLNELATPRLYENIAIEQEVDYDYNDHTLPLEPLLLSCSWHKHRLHFVKNLHFHLQLHEEFYDSEARCIHTQSTPGAADECEDSWEDSFDFFLSPDTPVASFLDKLKDNNLLTFSWGLKTCIPVQLFGADGYLATRQSRIQSLSLVTDILCHHDTAGDSLDLTSFKHLRDFSWRNVRTDSGALQILRAWFQSDIPYLETLELCFDLRAGAMDFISDDDTEDDPDSELYVPAKYVPEPESELFFHLSQSYFPGTKFPKFLSLKSLNLTNACIAPVYPDIACFFNFSRLQTLKLRCCPNATRLLHAVVKSHIPIQLKTFEFFTFTRSRKDGDLALVPFLRSFRGLEQLYLEVQHGDHEIPIFIQSIAEHRSTLKRLAYRAYHLKRDANHFDQHNIVDFGHGDLLPNPEITQQLCDSMKPLGTSILEQGKLECFSFRITLLILKPILRAPILGTLKLLHIQYEFPLGGSELTADEEYFYRYFSIDKETLKVARSRKERFEDTINEPIADTLPLDERCHKTVSDPSMSYRNALRDFIYWAFNDGFPGLKYLSYGDFSEGYFGYPYNVVFCRDPSEESMVKILKSSDDMMHFKGSYRTFLQSLPIWADNI